MPPEQIEPGSPADWLRHAESDFTLASQPPIPGVLLEMLCFHAQQAVEKSLKAVLIHNDVDFPYTHSIANLITLVQESGIDWRDDLNEAAGLTSYAVHMRYPSTAEEATEDDYKQAISIAKAVLHWAEQIIKT